MKFTNSAKFLPQVAPAACLAPEEKLPKVKGAKVRMFAMAMVVAMKMLTNLCCAGGVDGHVRCLLGLAGGVRNLTK